MIENRIELTHKPLRIPNKRLVITKQMAERAVANTKSNMEAARWLDVHYVTWKKWAKYYDLFEQHKNQQGRGIKKGWATYRISLENIFNGKRKSPYSLGTLKRRMIDEGYMQEECSLCSWNEKNIVTETICLVIDFIDGDGDNKSFENMRLLCPNCYYSNNGKFLNSALFCK